MSIDNCKHTFKHLADTRLPSLMDELNKKISESYPLKIFLIKGFGTNTFLKKIGEEKDFQGCYVFIEKGKPLYVGISQKVGNRISQHIKGRTHFNASWAYRIALSKYFRIYKPNMDKIKDELTKTKIPLKEYLEIPEFLEHFNAAKKRISSMKCAFIEIENPLELYVFEIYCCMNLDTNKWNTFKTH